MVNRTNAAEPSVLRRLGTARVLVPLALVVALAVWWVATHTGGGSASAASATEQLVAVTRGTVGSTVSAEGTVAAAQTANLSFGSSGVVSAVHVKAGDTVTAGEVLATIDSAQLASAVSSAQASLATAQAKLADDQSSGASTEQIAADQTNVTSASDTLTSAQQSLAGASLTATFDGTVSQVNVTVGEQLSSNGTGATSTTGTGTGSGQSAGPTGASSGTGSGGGFGGAGASGSGGGNAGGSASSSANGTPAIQVVSQGQYTVTLPVSASDVARVAPGQGATLTVTTSSAGGGRGGLFGGLFGGGAGGRGAGGASGAAGAAGGANPSGSATTGLGATATGVVASVSKVASTSSGVAGYPVVISFDADANAFYPGATVTASITTQAKQDVLEVPTRAISSRNGSPVVTVATTGKLGGPTTVRTVSTGLTAGGETEVTAGLHQGEQVVITLPSFGGFNGGGAGRTGTGVFGGFNGGGTGRTGGSGANGGG